MDVALSSCSLSIQAYNALQAQRYSTTKSLGYTAIVLSVVNIAYTGVVTILVVGLTIGLYCNGKFSTVMMNPVAS